MQFNRLTKITAALMLAGLSATALAANAAAPHLPLSASVHKDGKVQVDANNRALYIVRLGQASVATHLHAQASSGASATANIDASSVASASRKLDLKSPEAASYAANLMAQQQSVLTSGSTMLRRSLVAERQYRYALNGFSVRLTAQEAAAMRKISGVANVMPVRNSELKTNVSMPLIGAPLVWNDPAPIGNRGEGAVVNMLDTGINFSSPAFYGQESSLYFPWYPLGGPSYQFVNPNGSGNYLGWCNAGHYPDDATGHDPCNDKVIGTWDFVNAPASADASAVPDLPGAIDQDGHGSHTSSTSVGNARGSLYLGGAYILNGAAPHANLVISQVCYDYHTAPGQAADTIGSTCPDNGSVDAVEQAVADGVANVISYSIGPTGGDNDSPWDDAVQMAFLGAVDAGIFVSAAAGNDGASGASHISNQAPWIATVAATTTTRQSFHSQLIISKPANPPKDASPLFVNYAGGAVFNHAFGATTPVVVSSGFATTSDGCVAYPAGTFTKSIAMIERGTCTFATKEQNAVDAGAIAVIIVNNRAGAVGGITNAADLPVPVFTMLQDDGAAFAAVAATDNNVTLAELSGSTALAGLADQVASFSSIGPNSQVNSLKPDIGAPGVDILASLAGAYDSVGEDNGTSMATPHIAGSAALVHVAHPTWSPSAIKSALMMTAKNTGLQTQQADGTLTSTTPDEIGAGRVQVDQAVYSELVLDETAANYTAANPEVGGDPRTLNLASIYDQDCAGQCTFSRTFTSTASTPTTWTVAVGTDAGVTASASPSSFTVAAGATSVVNFAVDTSQVAAPSRFYGEVTLTPSDSSPVLHLPLAVAVTNQAISIAPATLSVEIAAGSTQQTASLAISNVGGLPLDVTNTNDTTAFASGLLFDQPSQGNFGFYADFWDDYGVGAYASDDFVTTDASTNLSALSFPGFVTAGGDLSTLVGQTIHFEVYADNAGVPAGNPETTPASYVWNFVATIGTTDGLNLDKNTISIDLLKAGATQSNLPPGKYWMVVYVESQTLPNGWVWFESTAANGSNAQNIDPDMIFTGSTGNWTDNTSSGDFPGMAMHLEKAAACGAPWLSTSPGTLTVAGLQSGAVTVSVDSSKFPTGQTTASAFLCVDSNDPTKPVYAVPVTATQN